MSAQTSSHSDLRKHERLVIIGSTLGTLFEWYDFFLFGAVASVFSTLFFAPLSPSSAYLFALIAFGAGFAVRPLGALLFGRLGDLIGRKHTFLITIVLMGSATFCVGLLPTYEQVGILAPILLLLLRLLQGLGLGGEYGGAAVYVAEHAGPGRKGRNTSWIQMTGAGGSILALGVVYICRSAFGDEFEQWGWRVPFLLSAVMLGISVYIRTVLHESPVYARMKAEGKTSKQPIKDTFGSWANIRTMLIALFGLVMGVTTVLYTAQTYSFFFLTQTLRVDIGTASLLNAISLAICLPMMWFAAAVSDRFGRKKVIITGCLLATLTIFPLFQSLTKYANPGLQAASTMNPVTVRSAPSLCGVQIDLLGGNPPSTQCDKVKAMLATAGVPYDSIPDPGATRPIVSIGTVTLTGFDEDRLRSALQAAGYSATADPTRINHRMIVLILVVLCAYFAMVYAPLAAALVEMFPAKVRYTALSFPYHVGTGIFGGFFPAVAFAMVAFTGDIYFGLWYPVVFTALTVVIGGLFLREHPVEDDADS